MKQYVRILFRFSLFCDYMNLEYVRMHAIDRAHQADYANRVPVAARQEYVTRYSHAGLPFEPSNLPKGFQRFGSLRYFCAGVRIDLG